MLRKGLVFLSALYIAGPASAFGADPALQPAPPPACPPVVQSKHSVARHRVIRHIVRHDDYYEGGDYVVSGRYNAQGAGLAWGLTPGVGQLGALGFGYYGSNGCWTYRPAYDLYGNYLGRRPVNICVE